MNVKKIKCLAATIVMVQCASCQHIEKKNYEIRAETVDKSNKPISNVMVLSGKLELVKDSPIPTVNPVLLEPVPTDANGIALLRFKSAPTPSGNVNFYKDGYYSSSYTVTWTSPKGFEGKDQKAEVKAALKPVKNPIPMIARKDLRIRTPDFGVPYGFDLEMGESLPPLGDGKTADIEFTLTGNRTDLGVDNKEHIDFKVEIRCPNPDDGFVEFEIEDSREFNKGSDLQSDHESPAGGYVNSLIRQYSNDEDGGMTAAYGITNEIKNKCAYIRARTRTERKRGNCLRLLRENVWSD